MLLAYSRAAEGSEKNVVGSFADVLNKADDIRQLDLARSVRKT
jgi:hypothetical protein